MVKPNFLIVGAPKSGTTSLYHYLGQHPDISFPEMKEPKYFSFASERLNSDNKFIKNLNRFTIKTEAEYLELFKSLNSRCIGEASPQYFASPQAPERIASFNSEMKILLLLRNPAIRAYSPWKHNRQNRVEKIANFKKAFFLSGKRDPNSENIYTNYFEDGLYAKHLNNYINFFPVRQIHIVFFDDFISSPEKTLKDVIGFLDPSIPIIKLKTTSVYMSTTYSPKYPIIERIAKLTKFRFPNLSNNLQSFNKIGPIKTESYKLLLEYYLEDIKQLEAMTGRDLSNWKH